ncbi:2-isopropylmalate synthase [Halanaerobium sp. ST460_2HS_T2]|uniref:2-isopropylmalate synthase n=1 Tax=Halanaerobium sp. ST460_2HS_T2 TaxID=2183914 RepID=UPI000DF27FA8|nr:2-isopropylmalate synthase [Halanaerobium sp. ST460_2HS_T2]RCW61183.1 2-isopropylmalate synthase [Halanaerobium sp. ST460_2HS_T2]
MAGVKIFDTTLRDGEQSPGVTLIPEEKLAIAKQLAKMKVNVIEAGFPISSDGDFNAVKMVAENVKGVEVAALARCRKSDIDRAWEAVQHAENPRIHVFIASSPIHLEYKLQMSEDEVLNNAVEAVKYAAQYTDNIEFSAEDASRTGTDFLARLFEAVIDVGAKVINIPDTVGYAVPSEFGQLIKDVKEKTPNIDQAEISVHCHNDLGLAVANSLAAIENGASQVEVSVNGIGERAGNAALEEIVMALYTRQDYYNLDITQDTTQIARLSKLVANSTGITLQANKAIVGANAFAHEAGIHQDGVIKERTTYEIMDAKTIGLDHNKLVLGKHSGRHALKDFLEKYDYELDQESFESFFKRFKDLADKKKNVSNADIIALLDNELYDYEKIYEMEYISVLTGKGLLPTATVRLKKEGEIIQSAACNGDGPVDAIFQTINELTGIEDIKLMSYKIDAVTEGKDALGEAFIAAEIDGKIFTGHSSQTDITEASAAAYIEAINKYLVYTKNK